MAVLGNNIPKFEDHERFLSKIKLDDKGCWIFTGGISKVGYGVFSVHNRSCSAHRVSFEIFKGQIDPINVIDHMCRNKKCVNPDHLRQVDRKTNTRENNSSPATLNAIKTHCPAGHELIGDNLYRYKGERACRVCRVLVSKKRASGKGSGYSNRIKTHCKNGHEYSQVNTYIKKKINGKEGRACKTCSLDSSRRTRLKKGGTR